MDIKSMEKEELEEWLKDIRSRRKTGYTPTKKGGSKGSVHPSLAGLDDSVAEKILEKLLEEME